jgi:hypothetical protein
VRTEDLKSFILLDPIFSLLQNSSMMLIFTSHLMAAALVPQVVKELADLFQGVELQAWEQKKVLFGLAA